ncbi:hypothetical protein CDCA_CDCA10G2901 [Cyanidium caldarium]|uniref:PROP1-like PPR domain-containing protein n=1 Tax=Cyanidium caldarium TaxID=2771 RepID=A0AAV9IX54_CYACA|nr:hypothetical protein CDCA_CDCA10G2901 [Cyanidium caldarium]
MLPPAREQPGALPRGHAPAAEAVPSEEQLMFQFNECLLEAERVANQSALQVLGDAGTKAPAVCPTRNVGGAGDRNNSGRNGGNASLVGNGNNGSNTGNSADSAFPRLCVERSARWRPLRPGEAFPPGAANWSTGDRGEAGAWRWRNGGADRTVPLSDAGNRGAGTWRASAPSGTGRERRPRSRTRRAGAPTATTSAAAMSLWPLSIVTAAATATDSARELNARMSVLCKAKRHAEALALSVEAERHGRVHFDVATYSMVISCYGKLEQGEQALRAYYEMGIRGVRPNSFTFSALFEALGRCGMAEQAIRLFHRVKQEHTHALNVVAYNAILKVVGRAGRIESAFQIVDEMESSAHAEPDVVTYGTLMDICAKRHDDSLAFSVLQRMRARGLRPNRFCFASLIDACAKANAPRRAELAFQEMEREGLTWDIFACNALIGAYSRAKMADEAFAMYERMRARGIQPDRVTFNSLITAAARVRQLERALRVLDRMHEAGVRADTMTYNALIDACSKDEAVDMAFQVCARMEAEDLQPTIFTFNALIGACCRGGELDRAFAVLAKMHRAAVAPDSCTLNTLLTACKRAGDVRRALAVVAELAAQHGIELDAVGRSILTHWSEALLSSSPASVTALLQALSELHPAATASMTPVLQSLVSYCAERRDWAVVARLIAAVACSATSLSVQLLRAAWCECSLVQPGDGEGGNAEMVAFLHACQAQALKVPRDVRTALVYRAFDSRDTALAGAAAATAPLEELEDAMESSLRFGEVAQASTALPLFRY